MIDPFDMLHYFRDGYMDSTIFNTVYWRCFSTSSAWSRPSLRPGVKAPGIFDGDYCILDLYKHSRLGGSAPGRWAGNLEDVIIEMNPLEYLFLQMKLEGKGSTQDGLLTSLGPGSEDIPLVILAKGSDGQQITLYGSSLPNRIKDDIARQIFTFSDSEQLINQIQSHNIPVKVGRYITYIFPDIYDEQKITDVICLSKNDQRVINFGFGDLGNSVFALLSGGVIISACVSTRQNSECAESWVYTSPENRRMGFAQKVVMAWSKETKIEDVIPFYSHEIENIPSMKLANKLGLIPVYEEISIFNT